MIGIYEDSFIKFLKDNLGDPVKITSKNIICICPYCEHNKVKDHYHLYISLTSPIFHCFEPGCPGRSGTVSKLIKKIGGIDNSEEFVNKDEIKKHVHNYIDIPKNKLKNIEYKIPQVDYDQFKLKTLYLKSRFKFSNIENRNLKGLVLDINKFIEINNIPINQELFRLKDFLHNNFVGFLTEHNSNLILRNIDSSSKFRYYKMWLSDSTYTDYYKLFGSKYDSNVVVLSEGTFDILLEHTFDYTGLREKAKLYASALSPFFDTLCKAIVFYENIFRLNVHILSDRGVNLKMYENIKKKNNHIIESMTIYYNRVGKDFADVPTSIEKFIM